MIELTKNEKKILDAMKDGEYYAGTPLSSITKMALPNVITLLWKLTAKNHIEYKQLSGRIVIWRLKK